MDLHGVFPHITTMPRGKRFDVGEKAKVMAWFYKGILTKEIASRLQRDVSGIRKVINQNKALPLTATPPPLKGTVSRDNLYSIFFIDHILLVLLEVIYEDFKFQRIFAVLFNQKGNSSV
jgi:hypothetical protein